MLQALLEDRRIELPRVASTPPPAAPAALPDASRFSVGSAEPSSCFHSSAGGRHNEQRMEERNEAMSHAKSRGKKSGPGKSPRRRSSSCCENPQAVARVALPRDSSDEITTRDC